MKKLRSTIASRQDAFERMQAALHAATSESDEEIARHMTDLVFYHVGAGDYTREGLLIAYAISLARRIVGG